MPRMIGRYESDNIEVIFTGFLHPSWDDEVQSGVDDIEVHEAIILGVPVTRADVPAKLWDEIERLADEVEFEDEDA
jgi:hypothetical protein